MRLLCCPACRLANGVPTGTSADDVRCAGCGTPLHAAFEVHYRVAAGSRVRGPLPRSAVEREIAAGTIRRDTLLSEEDGPWLRGEEQPDLFLAGRGPGVAALRPPPHRPPPPRPRLHHPGRPPGTVVAMAVLDHVAGGGFLLLLLVALAFLEFRLDRESALLVLLLLVLGAGHILLGVGLTKGWRAARVVQLGLVGLAVLGLGYLLVQGAAPGAVLVLFLLALVPVPLVVNAAANAFFAARDARDPPASPPAHPDERSGA